MAEKTKKIKAPELNEIATSADGNDITKGFVDALDIAGTTDELLRAKGDDLSVYQELLNDDQVKSCLDQRKQACIQAEWYVEPGGDNPIDREAADSLNRILDNCKFDRVSNKMLSGLLYGFSVAEVMWGYDGGQVVISEIKVRNRRRFKFTNSGELRLITTEAPKGIELPDKKFWAVTFGADDDDEIYGRGLGYWVYWPVKFKRSGIRYWMIFLDKYGMGTAVGKYPPGTNKDGQSKLLDAAGALQKDSAVIIPNTMMIELLEATRSSGGDYNLMCARMDKAIAKVIIGQTASTEGTPGKLGNEDAQNDVRQEYVKADADLLCESFNEGPARWLTDWNFPGAAYPKVWRKVDPDDDLGKEIDRDQKLAGIIPVPVSYFQEKYSIPAAKKGEPVAGKPAAPKAPPEPGEEVAFAEGDLADGTEALADKAREEAGKLIDGWLDEVGAIVEKAESLEDLQAMIDKKFGKLDKKQFAKVMEKAMLAAQLMGRSDVMDEVNG